MEYRDFGAAETTLINHIYEAALDTSRWNFALNQFREMTDSRNCNLVFYDQLNRNRNTLLHSGYYPDEGVKQYIDIMIDADVAMVRAAKNDIPYGVFFQPDHLRSASIENPTTVTLDKARDFFKNTVQEGPAVGTMLFNSRFSASLFALQRAPGEKPYSDAMIQLGSRVGSHMCRAMRIHHQLNSTRHDYLKLQKALHKTAAGLALLDDDGHIVIANEEAARILSHHPALRIGPNGRIQATSKTVDVALQKLIEQMLSARFSASILQTTDPTVPVFHSDRLHPLKLSVVPLKGSETGNTASDNPAAIAIFITDPERRWHVSEDYLHHAYELTQAEYTVTQLMINGANTQSIAEQRGTTETTARWQLKRIMEKTATHSQAQLMQLLISLSSDFAIPVS